LPTPNRKIRLEVRFYW